MTAPRNEPTPPHDIWFELEHNGVFRGKRGEVEYVFTFDEEATGVFGWKAATFDEGKPADTECFGEDSGDASTAIAEFLVAGVSAPPQPHEPPTMTEEHVRIFALIMTLFEPVTSTQERRVLDIEAVLRSLSSGTHSLIARAEIERAIRVAEDTDWDDRAGAVADVLRGWLSASPEGTK
jgi:hypothetical protein